VICRDGLPKRKGVSDPQPFTKTAAPHRRDARKIGIGSAQKNNLARSLIDENQLPLGI
jgi:hypothetical protein